MVAVPSQYRGYVDAAAKATGLPADVVAAQIATESSWNPRAVSPTGAQGIAQFEPGTWRSYGHGSPFNPADAFAAYTAYMRSLLHQEGGNVRRALAAYNAGPGNLSAGYGYADRILKEAGQSPGLSTSGGSAGGSGGGGLLGSVLGLPKQVTDFLSALEKPVQGLMWFVNPANWARVIAGVIGFVLLGAGLIALGMAA